MTEEFITDIIAASTVEEPAKAEETQINVQSKEAETATINDTPNNLDNPQSDVSVESLAKQLGWTPDHKGDSYVDAATYILKSRDIQASMKDHNKDLKNQLSTMQGSIEALKIHNERVYKTELTRLQQELKELTQKKKAAVELADVDTVDQLDAQIDSVKQSINEPVPQTVSTTNPVFDEWIKDNSWYLTDTEMAGYADQIAQQYIGAPPDRIYKAVRNKVAEIWPEKFEPPKQDKPTTNKLNELNQTKPIGPASPVEGATYTKTSSKFTKADLTPEQLSIMKQFTGAGIMTEDQYINDIAKLQGA